MNKIKAKDGMTPETRMFLDGKKYLGYPTN
jgi:hypothetical protein